MRSAAESSELLVRACLPADIPRLAVHEASPVAQIAASHLRRHQRGEAVFATAWAGDEPLGQALLSLVPGPFSPEIKHVFVLESARRRGVGRALCRWLEERAVELGFGHVHLGVEVSNAAARALYAALGYTSTAHLETTRYEYPASDGRMVPAVERNEYFVKPLPARC